jgi:cytochrome P450
MFLPSLRKIIPELSGYLRVRKALDKLLKLFEAPVQHHKETYQEGIFRDFIDVFLAEVKKTTDPTSHFYGEQAERQLVTTLFDVFFAGSDTTINTLSWAMLYLCKYPAAQEKLQKEVGQVTDGNSRKVALSDRKSMPYTQALIDEVLRHSSVIADGVAHRVLDDFEFQGYFIPKNCWIQPNIYYIHHNPKIWDTPDIFSPERFLSGNDNDDNQLKYVKSENIFPFSGSKRVCIGETLARSTLFLFLTNIFQQFSVKFSKKGQGQEEPSEFESLPSFFRGPLPFSVVMTQRNK